MLYIDAKTVSLEPPGCCILTIILFTENRDVQRPSPTVLMGDGCDY